MQPSSLLIEHVRLIDPTSGLDRVGRLLVRDGQFRAVDPRDGDLPSDCERRRADGLILCPGFVDIGTELGEPGREEDESMQSALQAALAGGFTSVACSTNTLPAIDTAATVQYVRERGQRYQLANVYVFGCVSKDRLGRELAEIGSLFDAGAIGLSDSPSSIEDTALLKRALEYCTMFDRPIIEHPEIGSLTAKGVMHEDMMQLRLGLAPMPAEAEDLATSRNLRLVEATGGKLHLSSISTAGSVEICRRVRARDIDFSSGVFVANTHLSDQMLSTFDANCKVNPPLRSKLHLEEISQGLQDGTIDIISSGHRPHSLEKKMQEFDAAPFGMTALETTFGQVSTHLIMTGVIDWVTAIAKLSSNPAKLLKIPAGSLQLGRKADFVLIDPDRDWTFRVADSLSRSPNTPLDGAQFRGQVVETFVGGRSKMSV